LLSCYLSQYLKDNKQNRNQKKPLSEASQSPKIPRTQKTGAGNKTEGPEIFP
jgi:hypothetical protein